MKVSHFELEVVLFLLSCQSRLESYVLKHDAGAVEVAHCVLGRWR